MPLPRLLCIVGPTSSGKTSLSLALAKKFQGEIINADARQLYRGFDIGTGKPHILPLPEGELEGEGGVDGIPHHLFDEDPRTPLTVSEWRKKALEHIQSITARGHLPILVGGTGLYIQALVDNLSIPEVAPQAELRAELSRLSLNEMVKRLQELDPEACNIVDLKNPRRVMRALEVTLSSGQTWSNTQQKGPPLVNALQIGILRSREELYARAEQAVDDMIKAGWINEVQDLIASGIPRDAEAMSAIGYRELADVIEGTLPLEEVVDKIKQATRNYIKRQITWFKRDERIKWVKDEGEAMAHVSERIRER